MTDRKTEGTLMVPKKKSLRHTFLIRIVFGVILASLIYVLVRWLIVYYINNYYTTKEMRREREEKYIAELQEYIDSGGVTSSDVAKISKWVQRKRYVYLLIYRDDDLLFVSGIYEQDRQWFRDPVNGGGITVDYPSRDELVASAEGSGYHALTMSDGTTLYASVAEFTEYLLYDLANIVSLAVALLALSAVLIIYFSNVIWKISDLAHEVGRVSSGETEHVIYLDGDDEIAKLYSDIDRMRTSILENIKKEREAIESNNELITSMSHDIRTPLTVLLGYLDVMKPRAEGDDVMKSYIKASETTALRLKSLSDDMFRYFLLFGGKIDLDMQDYPAGTLLEQMLSEHILLLRESGYTVEYETALPQDASLTVRADAQNLMRVFDNIFSNIMKYADAGSAVRISSALDTGRVRVTFCNAVRRDTSGAESNGIGLRTCRRICEAMGAEIMTVTDDESYSVSVALPAEAPAPALPAPAPERGARTHRRSFDVKNLFGGKKK